MKIARFMYQNKIEYGIVEEKTVSLIEGNIFGKYETTAHKLNLNEVKLLAPCNPSKIVCVGLNYKDHAAELKMALPEEPVLFLKPPTSVIGPGEDIIYPIMSHQVDYEAELAIIIGREGYNIEEGKESDYILGYTCANDVTARDLQSKDGQWSRAKSFDTFLPLGPFIVTDLNPDLLKIEAFLNDDCRQSSDTTQMIFTCSYLVGFISRIMTLLPGDVIITGTPQGIGSMQVGDQIKVVIEKVGCLENKVACKAV